tara:strand:- start:185 stop:1018 length:834 start_codon:yes stop_codon:yes gene_type:complete
MQAPSSTQPQRFESKNSYDPDQIQEWAETFNREGYLFLEDVLTEEHVAQLKADLDWSFENFTSRDEDPEGKLKSRLCHRMFEHSPANLNLFDLEPIVSLAETLIDKKCHVIHNNSFITPPGGGMDWHQDDAPHLIVTHGEPPTNIRLPVIAFTCNYYLTDVTKVEHGGTEVIPGSHLFGANVGQVSKRPDWSKWEDKVEHNLGKAGSVVMFNNQVWHRGGPNQSKQIRYITQITYARRLVGHKYYPFMNYTMPEHVYQDANSRLKRLLGFLDHGAYG